jgi:hypothetical protein
VRQSAPKRADQLVGGGEKLDYQIGNVETPFFTYTHTMQTSAENRIRQISDYSELVEMFFPGNRNQQYAATCIFGEKSIAMFGENVTNGA